MALPRAQRIEYKRFLADLSGQPGWGLQDIRIFFDDFGIDVEYDLVGQPDYVHALSRVSDETLEEMYRVATGTPEEAREMEKASDVWRDGQLRLFISHLTTEKKFVMAVSEALETYGVHGFVAHEHLPTERNWGESLQGALRSMHTFIAFIHPKFEESPYCGQEVGWALGRNVPLRFLRFGKNPPGFAAAIQSPDMQKFSQNPWAVARSIVEWLSAQEALKEKFSSSLVTALGSAHSFDHAGEISRAIVSCDAITDSEWGALNIAYHRNRQVNDSSSANAALKPFYEKHNQGFPPPPF